MLRKLLVILAFFFFHNFILMADEGNWSILDEYIVKIDTSIIGSNYINIDCADNNNCMAFGLVNTTNRIGRATTDGGATWRTVFRDSLDYNFSVMKPKTADFVYPDTSLALVLCDSCLILRSIDKGESWNENRLNCKVNDYTWQWMNIKMYDNKFGAIVSYWDLFVTTDGGSKWDKKNIQLSDSLDWEGMGNLSLPDSNTIIINAYEKKYNSYFIIYSTDRGNSWNCHPLKDTSFKFGNLFFTNSSNGWATISKLVKPDSNAFFNVIIHTTDGGKTWQKQLDTLPAYYHWLTGFDFIDSLNGIAWGWQYMLWHTTDGGKHWTKVDSYNPDNVKYEIVKFKMLSYDSWVGASFFQTIVFKYSLSSEVKEAYHDPDYFDLTISPNIINTSDELQLSLAIKDYAHIRFEVINSLGQVVDQSNVYDINPGERLIRYDTKNLKTAGMYWLRSIINGSSTAAKPFIVR